MPLKTNLGFCGLKNTRVEFGSEKIPETDLCEDKFVVMNYNHKAWGVLQDLPFTVEGKQYHTTKGNIFFIENFTITTGYQIQQ